MIKAVFFDLYFTLIRHEPPREVVQAQALAELGIEVKAEDLRRPLAAADEFIYREMARLAAGKRSESGKMALWEQFQRVFLEAAGISPDEKLARGLREKMQQAKMQLVLFDDVIPALVSLRDRGLTLGLISNIDRDISPLLEDLGVLSLLGIIVTSHDTGFAKPNREIFQEALKMAEVTASEAIYVGDQYQVDIVGARNAGMTGVLIDRTDSFAEITNCPRISDLAQLSNHV